MPAAFLRALGGRAALSAGGTARWRAAIGEAPDPLAPATAITLQALRMFSVEEELLGPIDNTGRNLRETASSTFRTGASADTDAPTAELFPPPGSEIPATSSTFARIRFSKPVIIPQLALLVQIDGRTVGAGCELSLVDLRTCRIPLPVTPKSRVLITGTNAIRDISGNAITPFIWELVAGDAIVAGPLTVQLSEPSGTRADATVLPVVRFSTAMDEASVQANLRVRPMAWSFREVWRA